MIKAALDDWAGPSGPCLTIPQATHPLHWRQPLFAVSTLLGARLQAPLFAGSYRVLNSLHLSLWLQLGLPLRD